MSNRTISRLLWLAAFVIAVVLGAFQRMTGPTYPVSGEARIGPAVIDYTLHRSHGGDGGLAVSVPRTAPDLEGSVLWRRYPTDEEWRRLLMEPVAGDLMAVIPHQPPAGKVEYRIVVERRGERVGIPAEESVVARFRGDVPAWVLIPHILAMFGAMLVGSRLLLGQLRVGGEERPGLVLATMILLVVGGLFLGPVVQKFAFDAYWTGWPFGSDLTDNKTAVAVLAWLPATILALRRRRTRLAVMVGWVVMMGVFLIPHSMRGSQLDWEKASGTAPPAAESR
jgi:hypothetical protein